MTSVAAGRPNFGPNSLAWHEYGLDVMDDRGLTIDEMLVANEILQSFVRGFTTRELAEQQALQRAGLDADAWGRAMRPYTEAIEKAAGTRGSPGSCETRTFHTRLTGRNSSFPAASTTSWTALTPGTR